MFRKLTKRKFKLNEVIKYYTFIYLFIYLLYKLINFFLILNNGKQPRTIKFPRKINERIR